MNTVDQSLQDRLGFCLFHHFISIVSGVIQERRRAGTVRGDREDLRARARR
jgi:hypothetical protein